MGYQAGNITERHAMTDLRASDPNQPTVMPGAARYGTVARSFHWAVVWLILLQYATKLIPIGSMGVFSEERLNTWHLAVGPTILALMLLRLAWRATHPVPPPPADLSAPLRLLSRATHWAFYAILLVLPVLGWVAASGYGATPYLLGIIPLAALVGNDEALAGTVGRIHGALAWALLAIIALHVAGALYHALVKKDGVLGRMLPAFSPRAR